MRRAALISVVLVLTVCGLVYTKSRGSQSHVSAWDALGGAYELELLSAKVTASQQVLQQRDANLDALVAATPAATAAAVIPSTPTAAALPAAATSPAVAITVPPRPTKVKLFDVLLKGSIHSYQSAFNAGVLSTLAATAQCPTSWLAVKKSFGAHDDGFDEIVVLEVEVPEGSYYDNIRRAWKEKHLKTAGVAPNIFEISDINDSSFVRWWFGISPGMRVGIWILCLLLSLGCVAVCCFIAVAVARSSTKSQRVRLLGDGANTHSAVQTVRQQTYKHGNGAIERQSYNQQHGGIADERAQPHRQSVPHNGSKSDIEMPSEPIRVISDNFVFDRRITLQIKEKLFSWSGDDMTIKDMESGQAMFKMKGKALSLHDKRELLDISGNEIGSVKEKLMTMHATNSIFNAAGQEVCLVKKAAIMQLHSNAVVEVGGREMMEISGSIFGHKFDFNVGGRVVAKAGRDILSVRNIFTDQDSYLLTIAPGVDVAFMTLVCASLDKIFNDDKR